jgi:hypothetical protein
MGKRMIRIGLLPVIVVITLVTNMTSGIAHASSYQGSAQATVGATAAGSALAPCTAPLFGADKDCESTSPLVNRWVTFDGSSDLCTYTQYVDWGDGSSSQRTFRNPSPGVAYLIDSHTYKSEIKTTTYKETVSTSVDSGTCNSIPTTVFHFTHLKSAAVPPQPELQLTNACKLEFTAELISLGVGVAEVAGLFALPGGQFVGVLVLAGSTYLLLRFINNCVAHSPASNTALSTASRTTSSAASIPPLPRAFAYGASHPGKRFKPSGKVLPRPQITGIYGYQKGSLVYFSLTYTNPDHDAKGFGFVGINGAGWALESHPFSNPSYGIVRKNRIDYPFNLACGSSHEYKSWVEAWIYDSQGIRSNPVEVALSCTT